MMAYKRDDINNSIYFDYKIRTGYSKQYLALELLSNKLANMDIAKKILDDSIKIKTKLLEKMKIK